MSLEAHFLSHSKSKSELESELSHLGSKIECWLPTTQGSGHGVKCLAVLKARYICLFMKKSSLSASLDSTLRLCFLSFFFFFFFFFFFSGNGWSVLLWTVHLCTVHGPHKLHFLLIFSLKMGLIALFTYLKIILLQCFQFSVFSFSKISSIQTDLASILDLFSCLINKLSSS